MGLDDSGASPGNLSVLFSLVEDSRLVDLKKEAC